MLLSALVQWNRGSKKADLWTDRRRLFKGYEKEWSIKVICPK